MYEIKFSIFTKIIVNYGSGKYNFRRRQQALNATQQ